MCVHAHTHTHTHTQHIHTQTHIHTQHTHTHTHTHTYTHIHTHTYNTHRHTQVCPKVFNRQKTGPTRVPLSTPPITQLSACVTMAVVCVWVLGPQTQILLLVRKCFTDCAISTACNCDFLFLSLFSLVTLGTGPGLSLWTLGKTSTTELHSQSAIVVSLFSKSQPSYFSH